VICSSKHMQRSTTLGGSMDSVCCEKEMSALAASVE
jgi:hypothetical protein